MSYDLRFSFSQEEFISVCVNNIAREFTNVYDDIFDALKHFMSPHYTIDLIHKVEHYYRNEIPPTLALRDYIDEGEFILRWVEADIRYDKDLILNIDDNLLPAFFDLSCDDPILAKYDPEPALLKTKQLKTFNKTCVRIRQVRMSNNLLRLMQQAVPRDTLSSTNIGYDWRQTFYNKSTGDSFFCDCFREAITKTSNSDIGNPLTDGVHFPQGAYIQRHVHVKRALENMSFKDSICHLCRKIPSSGTGSPSFYKENSPRPLMDNEIRRCYGPYIKKTAIELGVGDLDAERIVQTMLNKMGIGVRWAHEYTLYRHIVNLFSDFEIQREASPEWLKGQRFDIYIPKLKLAIEYQGEQHFQPVGIFGGEEGLKKAQGRDSMKAARCVENDVSLVYFSYKDNLNEKVIAKRLRAFLG